MNLAQPAVPGLAAGHDPHSLDREDAVLICVRMMIGRAGLCVGLAMGLGLDVCGQDALPAAGPATEPPSVAVPIDPNEAAEQVLISEIQRLANPERRNLSSADARSLVHDDRFRVITFVDELLRRYPRSTFKDDALVVKLGAHADLALLRPSYLGAFRRLIEELCKTTDRGAVAEAVSPPQERTRMVKKARNSPCNPVLSRAVFGQP